MSNDTADTATFDHAALGVSVCEGCDSPSVNVIREEHGFVLRCARCEATLMDPFYPPGWEDARNPPVTPDGEETMVVPSHDSMQVFGEGGHAYLRGSAADWRRLARAATDIEKPLENDER